MAQLALESANIEMTEFSPKMLNVRFAGHSPGTSGFSAKTPLQAALRTR